MFITRKIVQQMTDEEKTMIHVYEEHIDILEKENQQLKAQISFLKEQLAYKTFGKPIYEQEEQ